MEIILAIVNFVPDIVMVASVICAMTPTPKDDELLSKAYKILEALALNIGKAKMGGK
jgi:hypothetical protein